MGGPLKPIPVFIPGHPCRMGVFYAVDNEHFGTFEDQHPDTIIRRVQHRDVYCMAWLAVPGEAPPEPALPKYKIEPREEAALVLSEKFAYGKADEGEFEVVKFPGSLGFQARTDKFYVTVDLADVVQEAIEAAYSGKDPAQ